MSVKVGINGFGRIGRNVLRAIIESGRDDIEVVAINDLGPVETNAHLLRYDSVHGRFPATVTVAGDSIDVGRGAIKVSAERDPKSLPWGDVDIALECTGIFNTRDKAALHLENGSKRVLVSAPASGADKTVVYGVNTDLTGLDLSLVGVNRGSVLGIQWAAVGLVEGDFTGWQAGIFHTTGGNFSGFQSGIYNGVATGTGFQWGFINTADQFSGFQLGFVNITESMTSGLQIGLVNIINNKDKLKFFPIVNWKF